MNSSIQKAREGKGEGQGQDLQISSGNFLFTVSSSALPYVCLTTSEDKAVQNRVLFPALLRSRGEIDSNLACKPIRQCNTKPKSDKQMSVTLHRISLM